jgi:hypothetical protein
MPRALGATKHQTSYQLPAASAAAACYMGCGPMWALRVVRGAWWLSRPAAQLRSKSKTPFPPKQTNNEPLVITGNTIW